jgi:hypothetical protein
MGMGMAMCGSGGYSRPCSCFRDGCSWCIEAYDDALVRSCGQHESCVLGDVRLLTTFASHGAPSSTS